LLKTVNIHKTCGRSVTGVLPVLIALGLLAGAAAAQESTIERDLTREEKNNALREEYARRVEAGAQAAMPLVYPPPEPEPVKVAAVKPVARPDVCRRHGMRKVVTGRSWRCRR